MISIITTLYHGKRYISRLLDMIEANIRVLYKDRKVRVEYILVNDSPEDAVNIDQNRYAYKIKVITPERNLGIHGARILGLRYAAGSYVVILDQDDIIEENYLLSQINRIGKADMIVCNGFERKGGIKTKLYRNSKEMLQVRNKNAYYRYYNFIRSPGQVILKKDIIPSVWYENIMKTNCADDYFLWLLLLEKKIRIRVNPECLYYHENTGENLSNKRKNIILSELEMVKFLGTRKCVPFFRSLFLKRRFSYELKEIEGKNFSSFLGYFDIWLLTQLNYFKYCME